MLPLFFFVGMLLQANDWCAQFYLLLKSFKDAEGGPSNIGGSSQ
jgi:hypothetical protein